MRCCLTPRSSGAPTACHAGHQALGLRPILRLLSNAPCRWRPLRSNVRPHNPRFAHTQLEMSLALTSIASLLVMALMVVVAGAYTPGYSHASQFISELGATGAPHEWGVRLGGFLTTGLLMMTFCISAFRSLPRSRISTLGIVGMTLFSIGYLSSAAFPCDPGCRPSQPSTSQVIHNVVGLVGYLVAPAFLLALARAARAWPGGIHLVTTGYIASAAALIAILTLSPSSPWVGLSQRLLEFAVLGWASLCGLYIAQRPARGA